jgi:hypothetical protein
LFAFAAEVLETVKMTEIAEIVEIAEINSTFWPRTVFDSLSKSSF